MRRTYTVLDVSSGDVVQIGYRDTAARIDGGLSRGAVVRITKVGRTRAQAVVASDARYSGSVPLHVLEPVEEAP